MRHRRPPSTRGEMPGAQAWDEHAIPLLHGLPQHTRVPSVTGDLLQHFTCIFMPSRPSLWEERAQCCSTGTVGAPGGKSGAMVCLIHRDQSPVLCQVGHTPPLPEIVRDPGNMLLKSWRILPFHEPANQHVDCLGDLPRAALSLLWIELLPAPETFTPPTQDRATQRLSRP